MSPEELSQAAQQVTGGAVNAGMGMPMPPQGMPMPPQGMPMPPEGMPMPPQGMG